MQKLFKILRLFWDLNFWKNRYCKLCHALHLHICRKIVFLFREKCQRWRRKKKEQRNDCRSSGRFKWMKNTCYGSRSPNYVMHNCSQPHKGDISSHFSTLCNLINDPNRCTSVCVYADDTDICIHNVVIWHDIKIRDSLLSLALVRQPSAWLSAEDVWCDFFITLNKKRTSHVTFPALQLRVSFLSLLSSIYCQPKFGSKYSPLTFMCAVNYPIFYTVISLSLSSFLIHIHVLTIAMKIRANYVRIWGT